MLLDLKALGINQLEFAAEIAVLFDKLSDPVDYQSPRAKQTRLAHYFESCRHTLSGKKIGLTVDQISRDLNAKATWLTGHIRDNEWIHNSEGLSWFNGYYDDNGQSVEGDHPKGVRMILTGQVFTLMGGIATDDQAREIIKAVDHYLFDKSVGGYRLNTNFGEVSTNLGRAFGFAFGHKENGAMFSHMAVMYAYALYQRGFVQDGFRVLDGIYQHCQNFPVSRLYPGIPEYINPRGRGMYPYLTGSASWYLLALVTEVYGVCGKKGDLSLMPKLLANQFDKNGNSQLTTLFAGKIIELSYHNPHNLDYGEYQVENILINRQPVSFSRKENAVLIPRIEIEKTGTQTVRLDVSLAQILEK
jgi:cellobiose phosphorylase